MDILRNLVKRRSVQVAIGLALLIGCVAILTDGSRFVKEHSLVVLVVFVLVVAAIDLRT